MEILIGNEYVVSNEDIKIDNLLFLLIGTRLYCEEYVSDNIVQFLVSGTSIRFRTRVKDIEDKLSAIPKLAIGAKAKVIKSVQIDNVLLSKGVIVKITNITTSHVEINYSNVYIEVIVEVPKGIFFDNFLIDTL